MAVMGRPRKLDDVKDVETFKRLCHIQCTEEEICAVMGVDKHTLIDWCKRNFDLTFFNAYKIYSCEGKVSLRRQQMKHAEKSVPMSIFLGKQYLGQRDVVETETHEKIEFISDIEPENNDDDAL